VDGATLTILYGLEVDPLPSTLSRSMPFSQVKLDVPSI
jgi:hypothetical protein